MLNVRTGGGRFERRDIERVASILAGGGVGVLPSDTVYGLAASAFNREAVMRLLNIKRRARDKPLPVHVSSALEADTLAFASRSPGNVLIESFWPGPLTLVMKRRPGIEMPLQPPDTVGLRVPDNRFCLEVLRRAGSLVVPSANISGMPPPVLPGDIAAEVMEKVDFVVDGGRCPAGVPSTVVDVTTGLRVLREGAIPAEEITRRCGPRLKLLFVCTGNICRSPMAEGIARAVISGKYAQSPVEVEIDSAGIAGLDGHGPTPEASMAMEERGIDIGGYRGQTVTRGLVESSDLVLVMEERQRAHASALAGNDAVPVFMLLKLAEAARVVLRARDHGLEGDGPFESLQSVMSVAAVMERNGSWELPSHQYEVSDPVGMPLEWYRKAADIMEAAIGDIVEALLSKSASST